jgi:murein DD-endopeptidase MepM/ murein hydrolase activator NlpD
MMTTHEQSDVLSQDTKRGRSRSIVLGKGNLLLALLGLLFLAGAYWLTLLPEAVALLVLTFSLAMAASRAWHARRGGLEYGLLRHPLRRELRPYLLQCLNHWLFWALFGATILTGSFAVVPAVVGWLFSLPLPDRMPYQPLVIALSAGALVMAALALVPRRRVQVATNVLVATGTVFLATQLVRIYTPPVDPVAIDPPLAGEWAMLAGGRSALLSHHYSTPYQRNALDFVQLVDGRGYEGDPKRAESWYGFGEPVLAPADGTVVSVSDIHPDEPIGAIGQRPGDGNHIILEIDDQRYAIMAHLKQGSARVSEGERVRVGQQIAAVGDSGNSLGPHLHFQVQDGPVFDPDQQARTIPVVFRDVVLIRGGRESTPAEADLRRGDHIRRIDD